MTSETLFALVARAYEAARAVDRWADLLVALEEGLGEGCVALLLQRPADGDAALLVAPSLESSFLDRFRLEFGSAPFEAALSGLPVGGVVCPLDASLRGTRFDRAWLAPQNLLPDGIFLGLVDRDERHGVAMLVVFRRPGARRWGARERRLGRSLLPHVRQALRLQREAHHADVERGALAAVLDRLALGLVLVDRAGCVHAANRAAERILAARDGLRIDGGVLSASQPEHAERLRTAFEQARTEAFPVARPSGARAYEVVVAPLEAAPARTEVDAPVAAVYVTDPEAATSTPEDVLQRLFGLTRAEAALASELTAGHSLAEAAQHLGVTRETVRSRLKQIFAKTETGRQAELVRLLLTSPAQLHDVAGHGRDR